MNSTWTRNSRKLSDFIVHFKAMQNSKSQASEAIGSSMENKRLHKAGGTSIDTTIESSQNATLGEIISLFSSFISSCRSFARVTIVLHSPSWIPRKFCRLRERQFYGIDYHVITVHLLIRMIDTSICWGHRRSNWPSRRRVSVQWRRKRLPQ